MDKIRDGLRISQGRQFFNVRAMDVDDLDIVVMGSLQDGDACDDAIIFCHQDPPFFKTGFQPQVHHALKKFLFVRRFSRIDFKKGIACKGALEDAAAGFHLTFISFIEIHGHPLFTNNDCVS